MRKDLNPYNQEEFYKKFINSKIYHQLKQEYDWLIFETEYKDILQCEVGSTPRQHVGDAALRKTRFYPSVFYYLDYLIKKNPTNIYDLGCGWNIFKKYIPNIIGVGAEDPHSEHFFADIHDFVDDDYLKEHYEFFDSVFSICALHYIPLSSIKKRVVMFGSMIKPGGRGWLCMNAMRMVERDPVFAKATPEQIDYFVRTELTDLPYKVLSFSTLITEQLDNGMNGNINIVFEK